VAGDEAIQSLCGLGIASCHAALAVAMTKEECLAMKKEESAANSLDWFSAYQSVILQVQ